MFNFMYKDGTDRLKKALGNSYCGPDILPHAESVKIATFKKEKESDGHDVELFVDAMPAQFYIIKALDGLNSVGDKQKGFSLNTGSGELDWAVTTAKKICEGMVGAGS